MPGEYTLESSEHKSVNIPILQMLHTMFKNTTLLDKIQETKPSSSGMYVCQCSQVQSTCHTVSFAMQSNWPAKMSLWKCSFPSDKRLAHSWAGWHFHWNTWPVSWVSQLIIWRPMVLQVLCNLFEDTPSADSVAEKFKTAKFQMVSLPREQRPDMINMCCTGRKCNAIWCCWECALSKRLQHFHHITGFPPDILHPTMRALCLLSWPCAFVKWFYSWLSK